MHKVWCIFQKELAVYFGVPLTYVIMGVYLALCGYLVSAIVLGFQTADIRFILGSMAAASLLVAPALTMKTISGERRGGTDELLLTAPVSITEVVVGKYLAVLFLYLIMLTITLVYALFLALWGHPDPGPIISGYLGLILLGGTLLAIGMFVSSLIDSQITSGTVSLGILLLLWLIGRIGEVIPGKIGSGLAFLSLADHFATFEKGIIDTTEICFFLSFVFFTLFLTIRSIDYRRCR